MNKSITIKNRSLGFNYINYSCFNKPFKIRFTRDNLGCNLTIGKLYLYYINWNNATNNY